LQFLIQIADNIGFLLQRLPGSGELATIPKNGDALAWPGKGPRAVGYHYISYLPVARFCTFS
jgi:hypothetical protein